MSVLETDYTEDFRRICNPVLVLSGDRDESVPLQSSETLAKDILQIGRLEVINDAPHLLALVRPEEIAEKALQFLAEN